MSQTGLSQTGLSRAGVEVIEVVEGSPGGPSSGLLDPQATGETGLADKFGEGGQGRADAQLGVDTAQQKLRPEEGGKARDVHRRKIADIHRHHSAAPAQQLADLLAET
ncbi:hypothetical protein Ga0074812_11198 [Parafrankia irregularis]|uniref:Uncharacterized protein n=1 Tax=Parafrankia irregularis TaxID=795642 RepID=A0A0S4QQB6_9ACTN|nr:hypothetical protein Ga0074812_11198 [Parafrankia irregularis]